MQQVGGALGLAVLVTLALRHTAGEVRAGVPDDVAVAEGYGLALRVGAALLLAGGVLIAVFFERVSRVLRDPTAEIVEQTR